MFNPNWQKIGTAPLRMFLGPSLILENDIFYKNVVVLIIMITYEAMFNGFKLNISDGRHMITATVYMKMRIDVYDVVVQEARDHPSNFSFEMVSYNIISFHILVLI